ncbi:MAG: hypothetical protein HY698_18550 [Deltaproteobacteria bacterium]|nr:hypothetical protein [Deltaproteobacteria bacterium]
MREINRACPIRADFTFFFDRAPCFFGWPDAVFDRHLYLGGFRDDELCAYFLFGWARGYTGAGWGAFYYGGDARVLPSERGHRFTERAAAHAIAVDPRSLALGFCLVKRGNTSARQVMDRLAIPSIRVRRLCAFEAANVLVLRPLGEPRRCKVRRAQVEDLPAMAKLMARAYEGRLFAPACTDEDLSDDVRRLPGFSVGDFYLAHVGSELVGVMGAWDAGAVRRTTVLGFSPRGHAIRLAHRAARLWLRRSAPLPRPGESFRTVTTTRVAVPSGDPAILRDLLAVLHDDLLGTGVHMIHVGFAGDDPLRPAMKGIPFQSFVSDVDLLEWAEAPPLGAAATARPYLDLRWI